MNIFNRKYLQEPSQSDQTLSATAPPVAGTAQPTPVNPLNAVPSPAPAEQNAPVTPVTETAPEPGATPPTTDPAPVNPPVPAPAPPAQVANPPAGGQPAQVPPAQGANPPQVATPPAPVTGQISNPPAGEAAAQQTQVPSAQQQGAQVSTPAYLADWSKTPFLDAVRSSKNSIADNISDYNRWADANGKDPLDLFTIMEATDNKDISKSDEDNEKAKQAALRRQKWESLGNIFANLGNFVGTLAGAPSQNITPPPSYSTRQRALADATKGVSALSNANNILAAILKDRADKRAKDLNESNVALLGARKTSVETDTSDKHNLSIANQKKVGAETTNLENSAKVKEGQAKYLNDKNSRENGREPLLRGKLRAQINSSNASAASSRASAAHSMAETNNTNLKAYGTKCSVHRYGYWAKNRRLHPALTKQFMKQNGIHSGFSKKNWNAGLIDQYNAYISDHTASHPNKRVSVSHLLD